MKCISIVLILTALAFADNHGCTEFGGSVNPHSPGTDGVTLNMLNNWSVPEMALGLDIFENASEFYVLSVDEVNDRIQAYIATTGTPVGTLDLDAANISCFGIAWNNDSTDDTYYTNDWNLSHLFFTDDLGSSWTTTPNPAGPLGRGMDFDGVDYWQTDRDGGCVWRFLPGVGSQSIAIPEVSGQISGLTVFPNGSNLGIAVITYATYNIYFYEWDGSTMSYLGSAACPASSIHLSLGLAYAETNGHLYWSYVDTSSNYHLTELSFAITSLEQSSWGAIKSSF